MKGDTTRQAQREVQKKNKKKPEAPKVSAEKKPTDKKAEAKPNIVDRPTVEFLPVKLTDVEIGTMARESARIHGDLAQLEEEKKNVGTDFKARMSALETRIGELNRKISSGVENRQVQCFWRIDYTAGTKTLFRTDEDGPFAGLPAEVTSYKLSPDERQMKLPIAETKNDKALTVDTVAGKSSTVAPLTATIGEALKANPTVIPAPGDPTGTDDVRTPAAETAEETKIRKWFNALSVEGRNEAFNEELTDDRTKLPYKRLPESDREILRQFYAIKNLPF